MFPKDTGSTFDVDLPRDFDLPLDQESEDTTDDSESSSTEETTVEEPNEPLESRK